MKHIKSKSEYLKLFESENDIKNVWYAEVGTVLPESDIYVYVQYLHKERAEDFWEGDLGERIEYYKTYKLMSLPFSEINCEEYQYDADLGKEYRKKYQETGDYPPIVIGHKDIRWGYGIIDGTHRARALRKLGISEIKAWVGRK